MPEPEPEPHSDLAATVPEKHGTGEQTTIEPALIGPKMIAPWWHFVVFFLIVAGTLYSGWAAQQHAAEHPQSSSAALAPSHPGASKAWLGAAAADLLFLLYCWAGVRGQGGSLLALSGGRWTTWQQLAGDIGCSPPFLAGLGRRCLWRLLGARPQSSERGLSSAAADRSRGWRVGHAFVDCGLLRGVDLSRIPAAPVARDQRQRRCRSDRSGVGLWIGALVSRLEIGYRDRGAGDLIWDAGRPPGQPSRQHHVPCLV